MLLRLIALSVVLALLGSAGWYVDSAAYARGVREVREEVQKAADAATAQNAAVHRQQIENLMEATHAKELRLHAVSDDRDRALLELDGLRSAARASGGGSMPSAGTGAGADDTSAISDVLGQCGAELVRVAQAADRHAADALMLQQAWPR